MVTETTSDISSKTTSSSVDTICILVIDTETTGLDHGVDELIGLALVALDVDRASGNVLRIVDRFQGLQEPTFELAPQAAEVLGYDNSFLAGHHFDVQRISEMVRACELVVAHNAGFDRPFVEMAVPAFCHRQWVCSLSDIDWWHLQAQEAASVEYLARRAGYALEGFTPHEVADAMVHILARPLPVTREPGFAALINVAKGPFTKFVIDDPLRKLEALMDAHGMVYSEHDKTWSVVLGGIAAESFQDFLVDLAVFDRRIRGFRVEQMDPVLRFSGTEGGY